MRIVIETIPHDQQRYPTAGDWYRDEGALNIRVSETLDPRDAILVALHEMVEALLCEHRNIDEQEVTKFDLAVEPDGQWADDPGHCPDAPYHKEHVFAECVERLMARELDRNWQEYDAGLKALP